MSAEHRGVGPDLHGEVTRLVNAKLFEEVEDIWPDEIAPHVSMAISLKRIADVVAGDNRNSALIHMLEQIAMGAQQ